MKNKLEIPIIDIFAGPGGLSEGFSRYSWFYGDDYVKYKPKLSIEKNETATKTLKLRAFLRQFENGKIPACYYDYVRASSSAQKYVAAETMQAMPEWAVAEQEVWCTTLGTTDFTTLHRRIMKEISGQKFWVLLGGPPCQAYSMVGRSRRLGIGEAMRSSMSETDQKNEAERKEKEFSVDERHTLYREYIKIVAIHQPPIFVMENVKGILSARLNKVPIFDRILNDLRNPWNLIEELGFSDSAGEFMPTKKFGYRIHSFVTTARTEEGYQPIDYLIQSERYGIPQERHRVILLGIRDDLLIDPTQTLDPSESPTVTLSQVIGGLPQLRSGRSGRGSSGQRLDTSETWAEAVRGSISAEMLRDAYNCDVQIGRMMEDEVARLRKNLNKGGNFIQGIFPNTLPTNLSRWYLDDQLGGVLQHETRNHMDSDFARYLFVSIYGKVKGSSPKLRHFPISFLPDHQNVQTGAERNKDQVFDDRFRVQTADRPATTITSHLRKDGHYFIHYDPGQCRSLTVREVARAQTFPDNYFFEGTRTSQYEQVGNAVPPLLAAKLASVVATLIKTLSQDIPDCVPP